MKVGMFLARACWDDNYTRVSRKLKTPNTIMGIIMDKRVNTLKDEYYELKTSPLNTDASVAKDDKHRHKLLWMGGLVTIPTISQKAIHKKLGTGQAGSKYSILLNGGTIVMNINPVTIIEFDDTFIRWVYEKTNRPDFKPVDPFHD